MLDPWHLLFIGFFVCLILGYPASWLAWHLNILDIPGTAPHKRHLRPTPLAGGFLVLFVFGGISIFFRDLLNRELLAMIGGLTVVFFFGLWDDYKGLSAGPKLFGQLIASLILVFSGIQVHFLSSNLGLSGVFGVLASSLDIILTILWLIGITNAMNMIDSMDGIVAGLAAIASAFFMGAAWLAGQPLIASWSAILLGIAAALYVWNGLAAKFFLGDSGSQAIGFLLAVFGILYNPPDRNPESSWVVPIMLLGVPILDTTLVVASRLRREQSVLSGRRDHTYHRLIKIGFSPKRAVLTVHLTSLLVGLLAFFTLYLPPVTALAIFLMTILMGMMVLIWLERKPALDE